MNSLMATSAAAALVGALGFLACATSAAQAAPDAGGRACFYPGNLSSWVDVDRTTVNIRVNVDDFYQLKLLGDCPNIDWTQHIGIEHQGSPWICSGLDATLIVPQGGVGGPPLRCAVTSIRKLSPAEVEALPKKQKP